MEALRDDQVSTIGVYGMGGVGKTTLAIQVAKEAEKDKVFHRVGMVTVSQNVSVKEIQGDIADTLKLELKEQNEHTRSGLLHERLKQERRVLIILDDVWEPLNLDSVGIPHGTDHKGCKILLTTRDKRICDQMANRTLQIQVLSQQEAWILFNKMAGENIVQSPHILSIAVEVVKECAGLPLAIVTVATALRNQNDKRIWTDALHQLKNPSSQSIEGYSRNVISSLQLSYNFLASKQIKNFFLLCCLFPEDFRIAIEDLVKYGMGLRLFDNMTQVEARNRAARLVDDLKSRCLLMHVEDGEKECVKMHDVIRDFAISVASSSENSFLVRTGLKSVEWPDKEAFNNYTAISLIDSVVKELPSGTDYPKLQLLVLSSPPWKKIETKISSTFFESTKNLRVLGITRTILDTMSLASFQCLKNLRVLCLINCLREDISFVGHLKDLEVLSFAGSNIRELPREVGQLTKLKLLDVTSCKKLEVIPAGVFECLSRLECLYMRDSFKNWEASDEGIERHNSSLAELDHLRCSLNALDIEVPDIKLYPKDLIFKNLTEYKISLGSLFQYGEHRSYSKILKVGFRKNISLEGNLRELIETN